MAAPAVRIAPFRSMVIDNYTLGHAGQQSADIWNGPAYRDFRAGLLSDKPRQLPNCGLRWSL